jgi:hypothetical protein
MINEVSFEVLDIYLKTFLLLYPDDTVLISENVNALIEGLMKFLYFLSCSKQSIKHFVLAL